MSDCRDTTIYITTLAMDCLESLEKWHRRPSGRVVTPSRDEKWRVFSPLKLHAIDRRLSGQFSGGRIERQIGASAVAIDPLIDQRCLSGAHGTAGSDAAAPPLRSTHLK